MKKNCLICEKEFKVPFCLIKIGKGKYCSQKCYWISIKGKSAWNKGLLTSKPKKCKFCEEEYRSSNETYCSHFCQVGGLRRGDTKEAIKRSLRRRSMSSLELKFQQIIDRHNLPYKFVGNGKFFIERKNPDFVNINGEKKAIEVYYRKHKEIFRNHIDQWKEKRQKIFLKYGWKILFFDETQVNKNYILENI